MLKFSPLRSARQKALEDLAQVGNDLKRIRLLNVEDLITPPRTPRNDSSNQAVITTPRRAFSSIQLRAQHKSTSSAPTSPLPFNSLSNNPLQLPSSSKNSVAIKTTSSESIVSDLAVSLITNKESHDFPSRTEHSSPVIILSTDVTTTVSGSISLTSGIEETEDRTKKRTYQKENDALIERIQNQLTVNPTDPTLIKQVLDQSEVLPREVREKILKIAATLNQATEAELLANIVEIGSPYFVQTEPIVPGMTGLRGFRLDVLKSTRPTHETGFSSIPSSPISVSNNNQTSPSGIKSSLLATATQPKGDSKANLQPQTLPQLLHGSSKTLRHSRSPSFESIKNDTNRLSSIAAFSTNVPTAVIHSKPMKTFGALPPLIREEEEFITPVAIISGGSKSISQLPSLQFSDIDLSPPCAHSPKQPEIHRQRANTFSIEQEKLNALRAESTTPQEPWSDRQPPSQKSPRPRGQSLTLRSLVDPDTPVVCRICETPVKISLLAEHTALCEKINKEDMKIVSADERLKEIVESLPKPSLTEHSVDCIGPLREIAECVSMTDDEQELLKLEKRAKAIPRTCKSLASIVDEMKTLIREKIVALAKAEEALQSSDILSEAPLFLSSPRAGSSPTKTFGTSPTSPRSPLSNIVMPAVTALPGSPKTRVRTRSLSNQAGSPLARPQLSINDFEILKGLTKGGYGSVFVAKKKQTGDIYAIKAIRKSELRQKNQHQSLWNERDVLSVTENPFVVKMYYCFGNKDTAYIVMEYLPGGDCFSLLQSLGSFPEEMAKVYIAETVLALEYLHGLGICHRDLKPDNLLIDKSGHLKLTDFGLSRSGIQHKHSRQGIVQIEESQCAGCPLGKSQAGCSGSVRDLTGTPDYMAPEILLGLPHGNAVDYWALGCILYEFLVGISPFSADTVPEVFDNIVNRRIEWPTDMSENAKDLIGKLLCLQTEQRLGYKGASEVKSHQFFAGIDWVLLRTQEAPFVPKFDGVLDTSFFTPRDAIYGTAKKEDIEQAVSLTSIQPSASQKGQNEHSTSKPSESEILGKKLEPTGSDTYLWVNFKNLAEKTREFLEETSTCASEPLEALSGPSLKKETLLPTVTQNELSQSTN